MQSNGLFSASVAEQKIAWQEALFEKIKHFSALEQLDEIEALLDQEGVDPNFILCNESPLSWLVSRYSSAPALVLPLMALLLECRADPNFPRQFRSPLLLAARHGYAEVINLLLLAGANPSQYTLYAECPLSSAIYERSKDKTESEEGKARRYDAVIAALIEAGADVVGKMAREMEEEKYTVEVYKEQVSASPLVTAVANRPDDIELIDLLIDLIPDNKLDHPFVLKASSIAIREDKNEIVYRFIDRGVDMANIFGYSDEEVDEPRPMYKRGVMG